MKVRVRDDCVMLGAEALMVSHIGTGACQVTHLIRRLEDCRQKALENKDRPLKTICAEAWAPEWKK